MKYTDDQQKLINEIADKNGWTVAEVEAAVDLYMKRLMERVAEQILKWIEAGVFQSGGGVINCGAIEYPRGGGEFIVPKDFAKLRLDIS